MNIKKDIILMISYKIINYVMFLVKYVIKVEMRLSIIALNVKKNINLNLFYQFIKIVLWKFKIEMN